MGIKTMERGFFLSILSAFALALTAYPNDCRDIIGDTEPPPQGDISQTYPYGITYKTPPYISKIIKTLKEMEPIFITQKKSVSQKLV